MNDTLHFEKVFTQTILADWLLEKKVQLDVLRLDTIHPFVSGNKWFKLQYYLRDAKIQGYDTIATFGGPFSNHIIATACACKHEGFKSIGIIRCTYPVASQALAVARKFEMKLRFVSKPEYKNPRVIEEKFSGAYWISEGGYGYLGAKGAKEILSLCRHPERYHYIVAAVGSGTMLAGLIEAAEENQIILGVSAMKNNHSLVPAIEDLIDVEHNNKLYRILHDFHFGGFAKHPPSLIQFMNETWREHQLPTDIVYTAKTFYAIRQMVKDNTIRPGSTVLMIHSGGLQGNLSLPHGTLAF